MKQKFSVEFLDEAFSYIESLVEKARKKVIYNIDKASYLNDPKLFKKLDDEIWEFRILYSKTQYRFLAFWTKRKRTLSLVIVTHGFVKKRSKVPDREIKKANDLRTKYLSSYE